MREQCHSVRRFVYRRRADQGRPPKIGPLVCVRQPHRCRRRYAFFPQAKLRISLYVWVQPRTRDFAHLAIALNRTFNLSMRYVTGHLSDVGFPRSGESHGFPRIRWSISMERGSRPTGFSIRRTLAGSKSPAGQDPVDGGVSDNPGRRDETYF